MRFPKSERDRRKRLAHYRRVMHSLRTVNTEWLKSRLAKKGLTQGDLGRRLNIGESAVSLLLHGKRTLKAGEAGKIASVLGVPLNDILLAFGEYEGSPEPEKLVVKGYVGADDEVILRDEHDPGYGLDEIDSPFPGYQGIVLRIKGNSAEPRYRDGELIAYTPDSADISRLIGEEVIAKLVDGRLVLKILHKGSQPNLYILSSINRDVGPIVNVGLVWAAPIDWHIPSRR